MALRNPFVLIVILCSCLTTAIAALRFTTKLILEATLQNSTRSETAIAQANDGTTSFIAAQVIHTDGSHGLVLYKLDSAQNIIWSAEPATFTGVVHALSISKSDENAQDAFVGAFLHSGASDIVISGTATPLSLL
jgi:hypothetical protein